MIDYQLFKDFKKPWWLF